MDDTTRTSAGPNQGSTGQDLDDRDLDDRDLTFEEYSALVSELRAASESYYGGGELLMDDDAYDAAVRTVAAAEAANPSWGLSGLTGVVAGGTASGDIAHVVPMLSLSNAMDDAALGDWYFRLLKVLDAPAGTVPLYVEPKLDGMAVAVRYVDGRLSRIVTRGTGAAGEDVTAQARRAVGIPARLPSSDSLEVRGEMVMTAAQFCVANELRVEVGNKAPFANPRNAVAGSIRNQSRDYEVPFTFCAYGLHGLVPGQTPADGPGLAAGTELGVGSTHGEDMACLASWGFVTAASMAPTAGPVADLAGARSAVEGVEKARAALDCGIDGAVVKADRREDRVRAGATGSAPRWAIARKFKADTKSTRLVDIEVNMGRTGALTVRAVLEPVEVAGVTVTHATLSNMSQIEAKGLSLNSWVWVRRAGDVIPEITGVDTTRPADGLVGWVPPSACPRCGSALDKSEKTWRCVKGRACGLPEAITYAASRDCLDLEGLGPRLAAALVEAGLVGDLADLYALSSSQVAGLDRMGDKAAAKVVAQIEASKSLPFSKVFAALGIRLTGRRMSRRIAAKFPSVAALRAATVDGLAEVEGVGVRRAETILEGLAELSDVIDRMLAAGVVMVEPSAADAAQPGSGGLAALLAGKTVCITGKIDGFTRDSAAAAAEAAGAKVSSSVSAKTDVLVAGDGTAGGSKMTKAAALGITVLDGATFARLARL